MSNQTEIMRAVADLVKAMAILKEKQEAIEQKLITPSFEKGGHINNKDGEFIAPLNKAFDRNKGWGTITGNVELTNYHNPTDTSVPVTIEDLQLLKNWMYTKVSDNKRVMSPSEFFQKYLP